MKKIREKAFDVQDPSGKIKRVSAEQIQFMYPVKHYLTVLPQMEIFERTAKYISHPSLMPNLYKELKKMELDRQQTDQTSTQNDSSPSDDAAHDYNCIQGQLEN